MGKSCADKKALDMLNGVKMESIKVTAFTNVIGYRTKKRLDRFLRRFFRKEKNS